MGLEYSALQRLAQKTSRRETEERARELVAETKIRKEDGLELYRPLAQTVDFHRSTAPERILRGGNRAGKSVAAFADIASAALRQPIIGRDGKPLPTIYPQNRPLVIWIIGYGEKDITTPIFRLLFQKGAFRVIRDLKTGKLRAWDPDDPEDMAREEETEPSPPLIPKRAIAHKGWAWKSRAAHIFIRCTLKNGTQIYAFTSNAEAKQGDPVDLIHINEDIQFEDRLPEWRRRLIDHRGKLTWAAFPHNANQALMKMHHRAEEQKGRVKPDIEEWVLRSRDNKHLPQDELRRTNEGQSEAEVRARDLGEFVLDTVQMFPTFHKEVHCVVSEEAARERGLKLDLVLRQGGLQPPLDWTRFLVVDPGHTHPAVLFAAVPPPSFGDYLVLYDEIYKQYIDAYTLAEIVLEKAGGQNFEAFLIDGRAGRQTPMGFNWTIKEQYARAFEKCRLESNLTDSSFMDGSDDLLGRNEIIRNWLRTRPDAPPKIRVIGEMCPNAVNEFRDYRKIMKQKVIDDQPLDKWNHLMSCLGYLVAYDPKYAPPQPAKAAPTAAWLAYQQWTKAEKKTGDNAVHLGPAA